MEENFRFEVDSMIKKASEEANKMINNEFIYDVENVVKVRTGEEGYDALQDVE